jgi:hypothetical protein
MDSSILSMSSRERIPTRLKEAGLTDGCLSIRHGLVLFTLESHKCLTGMEAARGARQTDDLNLIEELVRRAIIDDDSMGLLLYLPTDERVKGDPPDFKPF